jgi:hypothetical protein
LVRPVAFLVGSEKNWVGRNPGGPRSKWAEIQVSRDPGGPRFSRHPSRGSSQWRMVPLGLPEGAYKGPDGLGSTQWWAEITTTPSARLSLGSA